MGYLFGISYNATLNSKEELVRYNKRDHEASLLGNSFIHAVAAYIGRKSLLEGHDKRHYTEYR